VPCASIAVGRDAAPPREHHAPLHARIHLPARLFDFVAAINEARASVNDRTRLADLGNGPRIDDRVERLVPLGGVEETLVVEGDEVELSTRDGDGAATVERNSGSF